MKRISFFKNRRLMTQIGFIFFAFMFAASILNMALVYKKGMEVLLAERSETYLNLAKYAAKRIQSEQNKKWLFAFWEKNYDKMDIVYDEPNAVTAAFKTLAEKNPAVSLLTLDEDSIENLPAEMQKLYAEAKYMEILNDLNEMKRTYKSLYLSACSYISETDLFYFFSASNPGEKRSRQKGRDAYMLGTIHNISDTPQPLRNKTWETGVFQNELGSMERGFYHAYSPVVAENDDGTKSTLCIIDVVLEVNAIRKQFLREVFHIENYSIFGFVLCALLLFLLLKKTIVNPILKLQAVMQKYQTDKNCEEVSNQLKEYFGSGEIGMLSRDFSALTMEINEYTNNIAKLAAEKQRISTELSIATTIQASILPHIFPPFPDRKEFDIYASMKPAKEVGGDFYDFFMIDDDHIALVIADVSGKGVGAALFMMASKIVIKAQAMACNGAAETLSIVNNVLSESNDAEMFVSVWIGIYEISSGKMRCANAGHEFPAIKRADGKFELLKDKHGFVLAGMSGIKYTEYELNLSKGDVIFVYTDGVAEASNSQNELFGTQRMIDALNSADDDNPQAILDRMGKHIDAFAGAAEQFDDITMLAFKIMQI